MDLDEIPDLEPEACPASIELLRKVISETRIKTRQKFHSVFEDGIVEREKMRKIDYDQDSLFLIHPNLTFLHAPEDPRTSKRRKSSAKSETEDAKQEDKKEHLKAEAGDGPVRHSPALRSRRDSSGDRARTRSNSRSSSPDTAPNSPGPGRVRRSSVRVQSPLVRYGNQSPGRKGEPVQTVPMSTNGKVQRSNSSSRIVPAGKRPHDAKKKEPPPNKVRVVKKTRLNNGEGDSPVISKKTRQIKGVTGLKNLGNTCYLNTIVQVLASLKCFRQALMEVECAMQSPILSDTDASKSPPRAARRKRNVNSLTKSLQKLVQELNAGTKRTVEPSYFVQAVHEQMPSFNGHLQQDVQEFFCQLLYKLNVEKTHGCSEEILNCVVNRMFTGAWQSEVTCNQCGNANQNREQFNTLPLEFPNKYHKSQSLLKPVTLDYLLHFYTQSEPLGRVYNCENCRTRVGPNGRTRRQSVRTEAAKRITVLESPKCLFIHLKRARYSHINGQEKINCHVDFPEKLNLGPYMTKEKDKENNPEYVLRAVVVHHGKYFSSGHYTTYVWNDSENRKNTSGWVQYNDSEVTGSRLLDVMQSQAYMLLYVDTELASEI